MYEGEQFRGDKTVDELQEFVLSKLRTQIKTITLENWVEDYLNKETQLLFLCPDVSTICPESTTRLKVATALVCTSNTLQALTINFEFFRRD